MSALSVATIKSASSAAPVFQNSSGTEKGQIIKAWINFNGQGTIAIRDSFNISSITDLGVGRTRVTFDNAMSNANFSVTASSGYSPTDALRSVGLYANFTTAKFEILTRYGTDGARDDQVVCCMAIGDN